MGFYTTISPGDRTAGERQDWGGTDEGGNLGGELHTSREAIDATSEELHNMAEVARRLASNVGACAAAGA